jgi:dTMP kinase
VGRVTVAGIMPNLTFVLDLPATTAAARFNRAPDRMEAQGLDYMENVRQGFLLEAAKRSNEIVVIDAGAAAAVVHQSVVAAAEAKVLSTEY